MLLVCDTAFPLHRAVQEVAAIELHARLSGEHFHDPAGCGLDHASCQSRGFVSSLENKIVIVTAWVSLHLSDARPNRHGFREIKGSIFDGPDFSRRNQRV